ncbi:MAG: PaaI family thioesterase [Methanobacteriota archaeon]
MPDPRGIDLVTLDDLIRVPPFHSYLDVRLLHAEPGRVRIRVPYKAEFIGNPLIPAWHGGILSALIDLAGGAALFTVCNVPTPTIDMRVDYIRPAVAGNDIVAEAEVLRCGKTVGHVRVDVADERTGTLVATGSAAYSVKGQRPAPAKDAFPIG